MNNADWWSARLIVRRILIWFILVTLLVPAYSGAGTERVYAAEGAPVPGHWENAGNGFNSGYIPLESNGSDVYATPDSGIYKWNSAISKWEEIGHEKECCRNGDILVHDGTLYATSRERLVYEWQEQYVSTFTWWDGSSWQKPVLRLYGNFGYPNAMAVTDNYVYVGGSFLYAEDEPFDWYYDINGVPDEPISVNGIARYNLSSGQWEPLTDGVGGSAGVNGAIEQIRIDGDDVYITGTFSKAGDTPANNIARWDGSWHSLGDGLGQRVTDMEIAGEYLYVSGSFTKSIGSPANFIARWDGTSWSSLGDGLSHNAGFTNNIVYSIEIAGDDVFIGGVFNEAGGVKVSNLAKWNASANTWHPIGAARYPLEHERVTQLEWTEEALYVAGELTDVGFPVNHIARYVFQTGGGGNQPPVVANPLADYVINAGEAFLISIPQNTFSDSDPGDALTYSASLTDGSVLPSWLTFTPDNRSFSGTPETSDKGVYHIKVTATDREGLQASDEFRLTVNANDSSMQGYLYGVILDTETNAPAPGLTLTIRKGINVTDGPIEATIVSPYGQYEATLPYGDYTAVITGDNYEPSMFVVTVNSPTKNHNGTITRKPESMSGYLYGVILDTETNAPAPGLTLTIRKGINATDGPIEATIASPYGQYEATLPYGDYTVVITGNNYKASTMVVSVNSPTKNHNGTITRKPESLSGYLYGVILDTETNTPAPGLTLTIRKGINATDGSIEATIASPYGEYEATLPYGDYTAVITGDNYEPSTFVVTVNSPTKNHNGTITPVGSTWIPANPPANPPVLLPDDSLTGSQPYLSWNSAILTEHNNGQTWVRLNTSHVLSILQNSPTNASVCTFGMDVSGSVTFEIPSSIAAAAVDKGGCYESILVLTRSGSYSLPVSVLKEIGGLEEGAVTRITIAPVEQPESAQILAAAANNQIALTPISPIQYSLTVIKGGETKTIKDFGNVYVQRSMYIGDASEQGSMASSLGVFLFDEPSDSFLFTPARFVADKKGGLHAIFQRTSDSTYVTGYKQLRYQDIADHWAKLAIGELALKGLVTGRTEERFGPDEPITRAEFVALLVHALGLQHKDGSGSFLDVDENTPNRHEILIAQQIGLVTGDNGAFLPNKTITREEMAVMAVRALQYVQPGKHTGQADMTLFKDLEQISVWALESVRSAIANGILVGETRNYLNPTGASTYAQAVVMLERILRKLALID